MIKNLLQGVSPLMVFLALTLAGYWLLNNSGEKETKTAQAPPLLVVQNGTSYKFDAAGKPEFTLTATKTTYYNDERGTLFDQPTLKRDNAGTTTFISANSAVQNHAQTEITMTGSVKGTYQNPTRPKSDTVLSAPDFHYDTVKNIAETQSPVTITTPDSTTHAIGTIWHLNQNLFILQKNVRSQYASSR